MNSLSDIKTAIADTLFKLLTIVSPKLNSDILYRLHFGKWMDWKHPQTSNEKILWLKFHTYYRNPLITQCADKYAVREYVKKQGCGEILNELYGVWTRPEDIDFDLLPDKFVLKSNYFYHMNLIVTDKKQLDIPATRRLLQSWMRSNGHLKCAEMQYADIEKKIIAERFIETQDGEAPADYKVYCCNGRPTYVMVCVGRSATEQPKFYYFDINGRLQREMTKDGLEAPEDFQYDIPAGWNQMITYAKKLSVPFPFVRTDFYLEQGKVIFGELTFTPAAGLDSAKLAYTDKILGDLIQLPDEL